MEHKMLTGLNVASTKTQEKKLLKRICDFVYKSFLSIWFNRNSNTTSGKHDFDSVSEILSQYDIGSYDKLEVNVKGIAGNEDNLPHIFDIRSISELNISINGGSGGIEKRKQQIWPFDIIFLVADFEFLYNHPTTLKKLLNRKPNDTTRFHMYMPHVVHKEFAEACENISDVMRMKLDSIRMYFLEILNKLRVESFIESIHQVLKVENTHDAIINCLLKLKRIDVNIILLTNHQDLRAKATGNNIKTFGISEIQEFFICYAEEY